MSDNNAHGDTYIISGGHSGKERLDVLSDVLHPYTRDLLLKAGLSSNSAMLDAGCGGGNVTRMAAEIAAAGHVTGLDFDDHILGLARKDAAEAGVRNVSFVCGNVYEINYQNDIDIAYCRFLLSHLERPREVLDKLVQSVRPGGRVVVEDVQFSGHFCYPGCGAFDQYLAYYSAAARRRGANPEIGPELVGMFADAGLAAVGFDVIQPCFTSGGGKWMGWLTMDRIKNSVVEQGIAGQQEVEQVLRELEAFSLNESTIISLPRIFRIWGTKC